MEEGSQRQNGRLTAYDSRYTFFRRHDISRASLNHRYI